VPDESIYFAFAGGRKQGPLSGAELEALARGGEVAPEDLVWKSGTAEWLKASVYVEFGSPFPEADEVPLLEASGIRPPPPTPPPPVEPPAPPAPPEPLPMPSEIVAAATAPPAGDVLHDEVRRAPAPPPPSRLAAFARRFNGDLLSLPPGEVFPLRRLLDPEALGAPAAILLLVFGLGPLGLGTVVEDPALRVRLFHLFLGALWATFLVLVFSPRRPSARLGTAVFVSTLLLGALLSSLLPGAQPFSWLHALAEPSRSFPVRFLAVSPGALLEEAGKGLLLFLLARRVGGFSGPADGLAHGLLAGLGFGIWKAAASTDWAGAGDAAALTFSAGSVSVGLYAFVVSSVVTTAAIPLLHAAWSGLVGYVLGLARTEEKRPGAFLLAGLLVATFLHSVYAAYLSGGSGLLGLLAAAATLLLLVACRRNAERLADRA
jgi:RsiW-degrading membrane proteinase PrsW (M82 family)